jgi:hypothetical protein
MLLRIYSHVISTEMIVDLIRVDSQEIRVKMLGPSEINIRISTEVPQSDAYESAQALRDKSLERAEKAAEEKYGRPFKELMTELEPWDFFEKKKKEIFKELREAMAPIWAEQNDKQQAQDKKDSATVDEIYDHILYWWTSNQTNQKFLDITPDGEKK